MVWPFSSLTSSLGGSGGGGGGGSAAAALSPPSSSTTPTPTTKGRRKGQATAATAAAAAAAAEKPTTAPAGKKRGGGGAAAAAIATSSTNPEHHELIKDRLLSPQACTDGGAKGSEVGNSGTAKGSGKLKDSEIQSLLRESVPNVDRTYDRLGQVPVATYIIATYRHGLPSFTGPAQEHSRDAIQYVLETISSMPPPISQRKVHIERLVEAFTACQAVQYRVIDAMYGQFCGREKSLKEQIMLLVDEQKQRVLDQVTVILNPSAIHSSSSNQQIPHLQNGYRAAVGERLGLRGQRQAKQDRCAPHIDAAQATKIAQLFREHFSVTELADSIVADVNQPSKTVIRTISRASLMHWAGTEGQLVGFDAHSIFFDPERAKDYNGAPAAGEEYEPFLNRAVAEMILFCFFVQQAAH